MKASHRSSDLQRLEDDADFNGDFGPAIVKAFRKVMGYIRAATTEQDFYVMKSLHYEKFKGDRSHQRSLRLNEQMRLIVEIGESESERIIIIVGIEDYH